MFDLFARDTEIAVLIAASAVLVVFPIQLALCFRAKKRFIKLLPTVLFAVAAVTFYIMAITARDWIGFAYIIVAVFCGAMLLFSGIAWGVWAITKLVKKAKKEHLHHEDH